MVVLTNKYFGGYAWDGSEKQFNLHPILMVAGFLFFYGNSVLLYKIGAGISVSKFKIKMAHFLLHLLAFVCAVVGLVAVFQYHNAQGFGNARSLHSWMASEQSSSTVVRQVAAFRARIKFSIDMKKATFLSPS
ncbi:putative cytochrome b ascorbate-dependent protein 3 [Apostichopus japonicus]|uniref:Putative cytochrome b ascorbate-dependent protein 3 n=1 Tax=Stichopus japonicus TaxID=307972 RepID=A0A2G8KRD3_STIJA|nr:putative cytochrome b ascorbate-dependent protein 3 [Apostichopus japonicus]